MKSINLQCPVDEWYLSRIYINLEDGESKADELKRQRKKEFIKPILFIVGIFILMFTNSLLYEKVEFVNKYEIQLLMIAVLLIGFAIYRLSLIYKDYVKYVEGFLQHPNFNKEVDLYEITKEGISINYYNVEQYKHFLKWKDIKWVSVEEMEVKRIYDEGRLQSATMKHLLKDEFDKVRKVIPDFHFEEKLTHPDKRSISIQTENYLNVVLPIPPTWEESGLADQLISFMQEQVGNRFLENDNEEIDLIEVFFPNFYKRFYGGKHD